MFSSGNRSRENSQSYPTQWALNPSAYQNVSNENVDWAALAQQWIMMKEREPPEHPPTGTGNRKEILNEGGEAPMDVEKEDAEEQWSNNEPTSTTLQDSWNWQQWGSWPGNWNGPPPSASVVTQPATASPMNKTALLPTPYTHFAPNASDSNSAHSTDYQSYDGAGSSGTNEFGYWTNSGNVGRGKQAMKPNRTHRKGFLPDIRPEPNTEQVTLDAAKRRQLPAWIREGLEKMEREKQKQLDKERERLEREEMLNRNKENKEKALELLRSADGNILPSKSKFDSDSGESGNETCSANNNRSRQVQSKSRRSGSSSHRSNSPPPMFTEEDRMMMVRRAMTEVLLQVTSSEIDTICQEEVNRFRVRTTASAKKGGRPAAPSAGPFAAGTLGLGMYGGGSSDSETESGNISPAAGGDDNVDNERRNSSQNNVNDENLDLRRQQHNKENTRKRSDSQSNRAQNNVEPRDAGSSDSTADDGKEGGDSQVDTTRSHGNSSLSRSRNDERRRSSSSNSSTSSSRTSSSEHSKRKKKKSLTPKKKAHGRSPRRRRRSSSSHSDNDSSSGSKTSDSRTTSSRDMHRRSHQNRRRHHSRSVDSDKRRSTAASGGSSKRRRTECSRSVSSGSESRGDSYRRRTEPSVSNRNHIDRSRRERSTSRSRHSTRNRRSRSRDRRDRRRSRSRTRSRDRRDSYRSRRRSRSRSRSRSGGGKRSRGH